MRLTIVEHAERDLDQRAGFWEKRQPGLGHEYVDHLRTELGRLLRLVESGEHSQPYSHFHRFLTERFSAQAFYEIAGEELIIYAVFDCREDPEEIAAE